jgi:glycosyltransferase involved in cell wall biosynthesis
VNSLSKNPELSVIVASYNARKTMEHCLTSLRNQKTDKAFEIIVVDSSADNTAELIEEKFPEVKVYTFSERKFCGDARNFAISKARGEIIAFIDADCTAEKNWVDEILKVHQSPYPAIGGAIANGNNPSFVSWAAYFCEFSQWMPHTPTTWMTDVAAANMSYKRKIFEKLGRFIEGTHCSDTEFHWRLGQIGHSIRFVPSILISHHSIDNFSRFISHEYHHGKNFALVRVASQNFSKVRKSIYVIFFSLIPLILFLRIGLRNIKNRIYLPAFLKTLPLLILGLIAWSLGECVGYIGGHTNEKKS